MIRSIANKTLASDVEQCRVMVKLFLRNISTGKTGIGQLCNKTCSEITCLDITGRQTAMIIFHIYFVSFLYFIPESQNYGFAVRMGNILMVWSL